VIDSGILFLLQQDNETVSFLDGHQKKSTRTPVNVNHIPAKLNTPTFATAFYT
jgi:hypothetical protein